jgi:protein O-mannosyl-transferase
MNTELKRSTCLLILVLVVLGLYYSAIFAPVNSVDDPKMLQWLLNTDFTARSVLLGGGRYYRPILVASFVMDKYLWGLQESFMHLENILLHLANTLLVFAIAWRAAALRGSRQLAVAFTAALFFAIHPINTEAVNWISGRSDLLAGGFLFLATLLLLRRPLPFAASFAAACCLLAACLTKETAIFLLPAALLAPFFASDAAAEPLSAQLRRAAPHVALFFGVGVGYLLFRRLASASGADPGVARVLTHVAGNDSGGMLVTLRLTLKALGFYAKKILFPFPLNFGITHVSEWYLPVGVLVCCLVLYLLVRRTVAAFFFVAAAAVVCSALLVPLLRLTWTPLAERYLYIPGGFFVVGAALVCQSRMELLRRRELAVGAFVALALVAFFGTYRRNLLWQDNLALFRDTVAKSPDFVPGRNQLAIALFESGKTAEAGEIFKSFKNDPDLINRQYGLVNKAFALGQEDKFDEARALLKKGLEDPGRHEVLILQQYLELNRDAVLKKKATSASLYPDNVRLLTRMVELSGDPFYSYRLGIIEMQDGSHQKAHAAFAAAAKAAPQSAYYRNSAVRLCAALAADPAAAGRKGEQSR